MRLGLVSFAILSLTAGAASAQSVAPPPPTPMQQTVESPREGLSFGIGLTFGSLIADCSDCSDTFEAAGVQMHAGWMVRPYLAVIGDLWVMAHSEGFLTVYQSLATAGARMWVTPRLWLHGGLGVATAGYRWSGLFADYEDRTANSPGVMIATGFEAIQRESFALSLELRYGTGFYSEEVGDDYVIEGHSVGLGATAEWY